MKRLFLVIGLGSALFLGACSEKTKKCEQLYKRIKTCMPELAENKDAHIFMCKKQFDKDATKASFKCLTTTKSCEDFKTCLQNSSKQTNKSNSTKQNTKN